MWRVLILMLLLSGCNGLGIEDECIQHIGTDYQGNTFYWFEGDCSGVVYPPSPNQTKAVILQFD